MHAIEETAPAMLLQLTDDRPCCYHCADRISDLDDQLTDPDGEVICQECFDEQCFTCYATNETGWRDDAVTGPNGELYCQDFADNNIGCCSRCDDATWHDDEYCTHEGYMICQTCYRNHYFTCEDCRNVLPDSEYGSEGYCTECEPCDDDDDDSSLIRCYSNKGANYLRPLGEAKDKVFFGVELEVECPGADRHKCAGNVMEALKDDYVILKDDGSLSTGFEIVTGPATVDVHADRFRGFLAGDAKRGLKSWDTTTCGMHVHVSREPLSDLTVGKILVFMNDKGNQNLISQIAGRSNVHWCKVSDKKISDAHPSNRYQGSNSDRYTAVNVTGSETIEFRIFKGTLKYESFMKNLEFVRAVVTFCRIAGNRELTTERFLAHVSERRKEFPNLVSFLRDRCFLPKPSKSRMELFRKIAIAK